MALDLLLDALFSSVGLPARVSRSFAAISMFVAGIAFLVLAIFSAIQAVNPRALDTILVVFLFFALSLCSFWLMYRAASERRDVSDEA